MISFLKKNIFIIFFVTTAYPSNSQKLVNVLNETITVNSKTAFRGQTRIITSARIPAGATGYIYRFTIAKKGSLAVPNTLFNLLKNVDNQYIKVAASLAELVINNGENNAIDAFVFNCTADASNFAASKDDNWSGCQQIMNVNNSCRVNLKE